MTYINVEFGEIGVTDLEYCFFDAYNDSIGDDWIDDNIVEETENGFGTGVYGTFTNIPDSALTIRWRKKSNHSARAFGDIAGPRRILNPIGLQRTSENDFSLSWDSRNFLNGAADIEVYALGSDGLWAKDKISVIIANSLSGTVYYKEFFCTVQEAGLLINKVHFGIDSYELSPKIQRRGWLQVKLRISGNSLAENSTIEQCETWWKQKEFNSVSLIKGVSWRNGENEDTLVASTNPNNALITQLQSNTGLPSPSQMVAFGLKITPSEIISGYNLNAESIVKIRQYSKGKFFILTNDPARIWIYDGTEIEELVNLSAKGFDNATDAVYVNGLIYLNIDGSLYQVYTDSSNNDFKISPEGEQKPLRFLETDGKVVIAIYADENTTTAYDLYELKKIWETNINYDFINLQSGKLIAVKNNNLYISEDSGITIPSLEPFSSDTNSFPYPIVATSLQFLVLINGDIYYKDVTSGDYMILASTNNVNISSIASARVGAEGLRAFAGIKDSNHLIESNLDLSWSDSRILDSDTIDGNAVRETAALAHYEDELVAAKGTPGSFDYVPAVYDDRLLIGTNGPYDSRQAMLLILQKSELSEKGGAYLVSKISYPDIFPEEVIFQNSQQNTNSEDTPSPSTGPIVSAS